MIQGILAKYTVINQNLPLHNGERWSLPRHVSSWKFQVFFYASVKAQYLKIWSRSLRPFFLICILVVFHVANHDINVILITWKSTCRKYSMISSNSEFFYMCLSWRPQRFISCIVKDLQNNNNNKIIHSYRFWASLPVGLSMYMHRNALTKIKYGILWE